MWEGTTKTISLHCVNDQEKIHKNCTLHTGFSEDSWGLIIFPPWCLCVVFSEHTLYSLVKYAQE